MPEEVESLELAAGAIADGVKAVMGPAPEQLEGLLRARKSERVADCGVAGRMRVDVCFEHRRDIGKGASKRVELRAVVREDGDVLGAPRPGWCGILAES